MNRVEGRTSEKLLRINGSNRVLLAALLAISPLIPSAFLSKAHAAPMTDGPQVCSIDGNIAPNALNPDPLSFCPPGGELVRLGAGPETIKYMDQYYPGGIAAGPVIPVSAETSSSQTHPQATP